MTTPDEKAYFAHVAEARDALTTLHEREGAAQAAYDAALDLATTAEQQATETAARANELVERSLRNARQGVDGVVEETLIPPRMRPTATTTPVGHAEVVQAMADLNAAVIQLRSLADRARREAKPAPPTPPVPAPTTPPPPPQVQDVPRAPWPLFAGFAALAVILIIVVIAMTR